MFENKVLRRIFGSKEEAVMGGWGHLNNSSFMICMYSFSNIIWMIKSRRRRWRSISMHRRENTCIIIFERKT
jgi:hypothetical protein